MHGSSAFPLLPGFTPGHDPSRVDHKRVSSTKQERNRDYANRPIPMSNLPRRPEVQVPTKTRAPDAKWLSTTQSTHVALSGPEADEQFEPTFVKLDRQVLRFFGYTYELVPESPAENYKLHKLIVYYYLEDQTISIIEPKKMNSGTPQGAFLKRQSVLKNDRSGLALQPQDFEVGSSVVIYGKNIILADCDEYTREYYTVNGITQAEAQPIPSDYFEIKQSQPRVSNKDTVMKDFLEKSLGGGRPKPQRQFLDNDRKVLRFYVRSGHNFLLHYYKADDTVEILECHFPNDGRDEFPVYLRRSKLPRRLSIGQPGQVGEGEFLLESEIEPDMTLSVFGREFQILAADAFTVQYYRENYSRVFPLGPVQDPEPRERSNIIIPPHNGIGSEEDSLGYIYRLIPKAPYKDYFKFIDNSHKILRWVARLNTRNPEDIDRRFIVCYFLNDDTIQIHEIPQRNSGIMEGKFLIRNRYKNPDRSMAFFTASDFLLGKNVSVNSYAFHIESCDEYTRNYMQETYGLN
mmetsp:Transcript_2158/g.5441  ORF Transcript_2158/g.5441 Transcript_2158/m.5441 type:complete len:518 (+) Transcript_2158:3540-5093(+)|eukprot:CAMPEP_0204897544 /NCGR_PEP_ID=MMETSP1397-20131031/798_1 /ASSEMBLY_ACC=CAM_ASM_000891 /TAXON_ID=49980 /ORGANISM="Climacostomum Climacostomum virens, Strain Stock W-24" /LENGTH=517 /DNA_ID=CAMNT_0052065311 /DNA_START=3489 /DNA_END=5042 /DNA_ORIENTATION=-